MPTYFAENQKKVSVSIDGVSLPMASQRTGGDATSEAVKFPPGGMAPEVSLGGRQSVDDFTVRIPYSDAIHNRIAWIRSRRGKGRLVATEQLCDVDGNAFGRPDVYTGTLQNVKTPEYDAKSTDEGYLDLGVSADGDIA